ncbi:MAG: hypothetical protein US58_C0028G0010 [Candidatus Magasanikbacteria bacterium GW2011_GWA2_37_8]|uniref:PKD domain-containing protein n=1 Tax=Candidatus Magasanikbacteria bacterium GW2011_GWA2_37_8 TaxID=1619036 RepID=A0A0G0HMH3_9BACT|nr:MAG: hypothetical protein US58_C0028G0010 [Candidatus Magasanikbacteria bacterium GW2011_GWA2_37_8]
MLWSSVKINEVSSYSTSDDWVELYNLFDSCVDLSLLKLWDSSTGSAMRSLSGQSIAKHNWLLVDVNNRLGKDADKVILKFDEEILDEMDYGGTELFAPSDGQVLARSIDGTGVWQITTQPTINTTNIIVLPIVPDNSVPTSTSTTTPNTEAEAQAMVTDWAMIRINEVVSDPEAGNEWVELYNLSNSDQDLAGGWLCDNREATSTCKEISGTIMASGWLKIDLVTNSYLNNTGDSVVLRQPDYTEIERVVYGESSAPVKGQSLARGIDGTGNWVITINITAGAANIIVVPAIPINTGGGGSGSGSVESNAVKVSVPVVKKIATTSTAAVEKDSVKIVWKMQSPYGLAPGEMGLFSVVGSADPRGGVVDYVWSFGDGTTSTGQIISHAFVTSGIYVVDVFASSTTGTKGDKSVKVFVGLGFSVAQAQVVFGEIKTNLESVGYDNESIELINRATTTQNLAGWKLKNKAGDEFVFLPNTVISVSSSLKFYRAVTHLSFNKDGDTLKLLSPNNQTLIIYDLTKSEEKKNLTTSSTTINKVAVKSSTTGAWTVARGVVTALPGNFGVQYFYIQTVDGGRQVYQYKKDFPPLAVGDLVEVRGTMSEISGTKRIKISNRNQIDILSTAQKIDPVTSELAELGVESLGDVVQIKGEITEIKSNFMYVDDGTTEIEVYFKQGAKIDKKQFVEGNLVEINGVLAQGKNGLQIWPRSQADIIVTGASEDLIKKQQLSAGANTSKDTAEKYLTATAGGITTLILGFLMRARGALVVGVGKKAVSLAMRLIGRG